MSTTSLLQKLSPVYVLQKLLTSSTKKYDLKTCINATDAITCIICIESVSCIVPTETSTCKIDYRNFNLQRWYQSEIRSVTIKKLSKWVSNRFMANSFSTPCIYNLWRNLTVDCVNEWIVLYNNYFNFQFSYLHTFYKPNNIKTKLSTKVKTYIQI